MNEENFEKATMFVCFGKTFKKKTPEKKAGQKQRKQEKTEDYHKRKRGKNEEKQEN